MSETCKSVLWKKYKQGCGKFSEQERIKIFSKFWKNINCDEKKVYVTPNMEYLPKQRNTTEGSSRRNGTYLYYLRTKDSTKLRVCKKMFLHILGLKDDMVHD